MTKFKAQNKSKAQITNTKTNYSRRERQWGMYHSLEEKRRIRSLKKLSVAGGIQILDGLLKFMDETGTRRGLHKLDIARVKTLGRVHSMFGRIKE